MKTFLWLFLFCSLAYGETVISPNMNLPVPVVGVTPGPEWANDINSCMGGIDSHDHTPGKGVPISSDAININTDLSLNNNSLTDTEAVIFSSQTSFPTNQSVYVIAPDLFYNDGNGNVVRITQSGSVSGASGTITGLPSGTASASYQSVGGTFQFQSATNTPANITGASVTIAEQVAAVTPNGITLKAPSGLAASYNVTFPTSVPAFQSLLSMSTSGVLSTVAYKAPTVQKFTSGSGTYTTPTGPGPLYIIVEMVGPGGGGGAATTNDGSPGSAATTFGTTLLSAGPGDNGQENSNSAGGAGGTATITGGSFSGVIVSGSSGQAGTSSVSAGNLPAGGGGGSSAFGGGGSGGGSGANATSATTNSGSGGGGGGSPTTGVGSGGGGGSGGYIKATSVSALLATYSYAVGSGGAGGAAGGEAGGNGAAGQIVVTEFYQ